LNNWFKIGMPVLVVILLVVCAVTITLLVTRNSPDRVISSTTLVPLKASTQYAGPALCPNCPGYTQSAANSDGGTTAPSYGYTTRPGCCVTGTQGNNATGGYIGGSCCGGYRD